MASSSSSSFRNPQKVCVVCLRRAEGYHEYCIYIVDLNSAAGDYFTRRDPTFRIRHGCFSSPCFCVLGSTLYVFQGYKYDRGADKFVTRGKMVYTYPLPSSDTANLRLTRRTMSVAKAPLKDVKWNPTAVPTPDGKQILVLPTGFEELREDSICSIELYDPFRQTSTVIRAFPLENPSLLLFSVNFSGPSTVLLRTKVDRDHTRCLTLEYDLQGDPPKWVEEWEWSKNIKRMGIRGSFVVKHGWCFTGSSAYDICNDHKLCGWDFKYPRSSSGDDHLSSIINYDITPLSDDLDSSFCTLRMGCKLRPFVMLDVYKFDFLKYHKEVAEVSSRVREEMDAMQRQRQMQRGSIEENAPFKRRKRSSIDVHTPLPGVEIVKSIRFYDAQQLDVEDDSFTTVSFFSIPTSSA